MFKYLQKRQYEPINNQVVYSLFKADELLLQRMGLVRLIEVHRGCVNTVVWDDFGEILLSGSDDHHLVISDPWRGTVKTKIHTAHTKNIFSAKFLPHSDNSRIVSCSGDGTIIYTDTRRQKETHGNKFLCHEDTCCDVVTYLDDPNTFLSCGEDGTVRYFDLRHKSKCLTPGCNENVLLNFGKKRPVTAIAVNPIMSYHLAVATKDTKIRIYDQRMLGTRASDSFVEESKKALLMRLDPGRLNGRSHRITSLRYSSIGNQVLASYSSDHLYLFDTDNNKSIPLETSSTSDYDDDIDCDSRPTLKRIRLRGDWSDTGPQALPESERRTQTGDVAQARPTLQTTLMQRMTDVLSGMLQSSNRSASSSADSSEVVNSNPQSEVITNLGASSASQPECSTSGTVFSSPEIISQPIQGSHPDVDEPSTSTGEVGSSVEDIEFSQNPPLLPSPIGSQSGSLSREHTPGGTMPQQSVENNLSSAKSKISQEGNEQSSSTVNDPCSSTSLDVQSEPSPCSSNPSSTSGADNVDTTFGGLNITDLTNLRDKFVNKHNVEPSISLNISEEGLNNNTISMGIGNEVTRQYNDRDDSNIVMSECSSSHPVNSSVPSTSEHVQSSSSQSIYTSTAETSGEQHRRDSLSGETSNSSQVRSTIDEGVSSPRIGPVPDDEDDDSLDARRRASRSRFQEMAKAIGRASLKEKLREDGVNVEEGLDRSIPHGIIKQKYGGHRNARTMIKEACFWGDSHVMSGSDCGRVFVWNKESGKLVMLWEADRHVVNCLQPHPTLPFLATSGIDYDIKLWAPTCEEPRFDEDKAAEVIRYNKMRMFYMAPAFSRLMVRGRRLRSESVNSIATNNEALHSEHQD